MMFGIHFLIIFLAPSPMAGRSQPFIDVLSPKLIPCDGS
jgi:hypothetical protein